METVQITIIQALIFAALDFLIFIRVKRNKNTIEAKKQNVYSVMSLVCVGLELFTAIVLYIPICPVAIPPVVDHMCLTATLTFMTVSAFCWYEYMYLSVFENSEFNIPRHLFSSIPVVVILVTGVCSYWNHWVFYIDSGLTIHHGTFYALEMICPYLYILSALILITYGIIKKEKGFIRKTVKQFLVFIIPSLIGLFIQVGLQISGGYTQIGISVGLLMIFLEMYVQEIQEKEKLLSVAETNSKLETVNSVLENRIGVIQSMSKIYFSSFSVDVKADTYEEMSNIQAVRNYISENGYAQAALFTMCDKMVSADTSDQLREFVDLSTINERLKDKDYITCEYFGNAAGWCQLYIIAGDRDEEGKLNTLFIASRQIHEEKRREEEQKRNLAEALEAAQHANRAKTTFLNNMSHDIRTPMNAIIGFTALAASHIDNRKTVEEYLNKISVSSQHLLSLINDVLDMSRIESGKVTIDENEVHFPDVLHDLRTIVQSNIASKQIEFFVDTQDVKNEDIITDKLRLNQILLNILGNAVKFTPVGGTISVRVREIPCNEKDHTTYEFRIKDTGIGMSEAFQKHIFESFTRERNTTVSGIQGTGLGMAITKNIIDIMGGEISVNSKEGKGTEFIVKLNFRLSDHPVVYVNPPELQGMKALVVDDDLNTCTSVTKMLEGIGLRSEWTTSGKEAVFRAQYAVDQNDEFKVYIIDWLMPDMNGIEVVRRIRSVIGEETPIIILTAYDWTDIEEEAREAGVTSFCAKPLFISELREVLSEPFVTKEVEKKEEKHVNSKRILVAEDNPLNQEIAQTILEEAGFYVDVVSDGTETVKRIEEVDPGTYDVILMDIQMPIMDGYEATRAIRNLEDKEKKNIPIIAMTANAFEEDKQHAFDAGMNAHLAKPINIKDLLDTLDRY